MALVTTTQIHFPTFSFFKAVFYITGGVSILWCILWFIFLSDEPRDHKCISEKEINFIETNRSAESINLDDKHQETKVQVVYPKLFQWSNFFIEYVLIISLLSSKEPSFHLPWPWTTNWGLLSYGLLTFNAHKPSSLTFGIRNSHKRGSSVDVGGMAPSYLLWVSIMCNLRQCLD